MRTSGRCFDAATTAGDAGAQDDSKGPLGAGMQPQPLQEANTSGGIDAASEEAAKGGGTLRVVARSRVVCVCRVLCV